MYWRSVDTLYNFPGCHYICVYVLSGQDIFFPNMEKEYLDILSISIIKSCLLELILVDRSKGKERVWVRDIDTVRESERAVMSAPWGEERPPVSRLLYRLPPFLSPPLAPAPSVPSFFSLSRIFFFLGLPLLLAFTYSFYIPQVLNSQQFPHINMCTHTHIRSCVCAHTDWHQTEPSCSKPEGKSWSFI